MNTIQLCPQESLTLSDNSCPVCYEIYNGTEYFPYQLPCGHGLCWSCTRRGIIKCPLCRSCFASKVKDYHQLHAVEREFNIAVCLEHCKNASWLCTKCLKCVCSECNCEHSSNEPEGKLEIQHFHDQVEPILRKIVCYNSKLEEFNKSVEKKSIALAKHLESLTYIYSNKMSHQLTAQIDKIKALEQVSEVSSNEILEEPSQIIMAIESDALVTSNNADLQDQILHEKYYRTCILLGPQEAGLYFEGFENNSAIYEIVPESEKESFIKSLTVFQENYFKGMMERILECKIMGEKCGIKELEIIVYLSKNFFERYFEVYQKFPLSKIGELLQSLEAEIRLQSTYLDIARANDTVLGFKEWFEDYERLRNDRVVRVSLIPDYKNEKLRAFASKLEGFSYDQDQPGDENLPFLEPYKLIENGAVYKGQWKEGLRHGRGEQYWNDGRRYVGHWRNNKKEGRGRMLYAHEDTIKIIFNMAGIDNKMIMYEGEWKDGKKHGEGLAIWEDGKRYIGSFCNNNFDGYGEVIYPNSSVYKGNWSKGLPVGTGEMVAKDGTVYKGTMYMTSDRLQGFGEAYYTNGSRYIGEWRRGLKHGKGELIFNDGRKYIGEFAHNKPEGDGEMIYPNGENYKGEWKRGQKHGKGEFRWADGKIYRGEYLDNEREGYGECVYPNGQIYKGEWKKGKREGKGELSKENEWKYVGNFVEGKKEGYGESESTNGEVYKGEWKNDERLAENREEDLLLSSPSMC